MSDALPITFPLQFPFEHKGRRIDEIRILRRAKAKDLIAADRQPGPTGREASLLAAVSDFDFATVAEMDGLDFDTVCARAGVHFLSQSGAPAPSGAPSSSSIAGPDGGSETS